MNSIHGGPKCPANRALHGPWIYYNAVIFNSFNFSAEFLPWQIKMSPLKNDYYSAIIVFPVTYQLSA